MRYAFFIVGLLIIQSAYAFDADTTDITFTGASINPYAAEFDTTGRVVFSGYVDTYYASYSDHNGGQPFVKFPTISPRNNQFGLNIAQASARYQSKSFRGTMTIFTGDCAASAWSVPYNAVQEANLGFRLAPQR